MRRKDFLKTHRCEESLKRGKSIRFQHPFYLREPDAWWLAGMEMDGETGNTYMSDFGKIIFCPYCGMKLED